MHISYNSISFFLELSLLDCEFLRLLGTSELILTGRNLAFAGGNMLHVRTFYVIIYENEKSNYSP